VVRESSSYRYAKHRRPRADERWDIPSCISVVPRPSIETRALGALSAGPTSSYLEGTVAVGIVLVQGPTANLQSPIRK
jgi:hypothetical protein